MSIQKFESFSVELKLSHKILISWNSAGQCVRACSQKTGHVHNLQKILVNFLAPFFKFPTVRLGTECCNHSILCSGWGGKALRQMQNCLSKGQESDPMHKVRAMIPLAVSCRHLGPGKNWWYLQCHALWMIMMIGWDLPKPW